MKPAAIAVVTSATAHVALLLLAAIRTAPVTISPVDDAPPAPRIVAESMAVSFVPLAPTRISSPTSSASQRATPRWHSAALSTSVAPSMGEIAAPPPATSTQSELHGLGMRYAPTDLSLHSDSPLGGIAHGGSIAPQLSLLHESGGGSKRVETGEFMVIVGRDGSATIHDKPNLQVQVHWLSPDGLKQDLSNIKHGLAMWIADPYSQLQI